MSRLPWWIPGSCLGLENMVIHHKMLVSESVSEVAYLSWQVRSRLKDEKDQPRSSASFSVQASCSRLSLHWHFLLRCSPHSTSSGSGLYRPQITACPFLPCLCHRHAVCSHCSLTPSPLTSLYTFKIQLWCPFSRNLDGVWGPFPFAFHGALGRSLPVFHHSMLVPSGQVLRKFLLTDWWKGKQKVRPNVPTWIQYQHNTCKIPGDNGFPHVRFCICEREKKREPGE